VNTTPKETCLELLKNHPVFAIWSQTAKSDICVEVATKVA